MWDYCYRSGARKSKKNKERNRGNTEHFLGKENRTAFFQFSIQLYVLFNFLFQEIQQEHYINKENVGTNFLFYFIFLKNTKNTQSTKSREQ